jgi:hypothetical protein
MTPVQPPRRHPIRTARRLAAARRCSGSPHVPASRIAPNVTTPTARAAGIAELEIVVDTREQYPYRFSS